MLNEIKEEEEVLIAKNLFLQNLMKYFLTLTRFLRLH